jgi:hypothetical protein
MESGESGMMRGPLEMLRVEFAVGRGLCADMRFRADLGSWKGVRWSLAC